MNQHAAPNQFEPANLTYRPGSTFAITVSNRQTNTRTKHNNRSLRWRWCCIFMKNKTITFQVFHRSLQIQCYQLSWGGVNALPRNSEKRWGGTSESLVASHAPVWKSELTVLSANNRAAEWHLSAAITYSALSIFARWRGSRQSLTDEFSNWKTELFLYPFEFAARCMCSSLCAKDDCEMLRVMHMCDNNFFWQRKTPSMHMPLQRQRPAWCRGKVLWMLGLTRIKTQCLDWSTLQVQKDKAG